MSDLTKISTAELCEYAHKAAKATYLELEAVIAADVEKVIRELTRRLDAAEARVKELEPVRVEDRLPKDEQEVLFHRKNEPLWIDGRFFVDGDDACFADRDAISEYEVDWISVWIPRPNDPDQTQEEG